MSTIAEKVTERAVTRLGSALRELKDNPVNEVLRGEELFCKVPCQGIHIKCRMGHPKINWILEMAEIAWDRNKLWQKTHSCIIPEDFNYKKTTHIGIVIQEALKGTF